jgi:hypothetical protein
MMLTTIGNGLGGDRSLPHRPSVAGFRAPNAAALFLGARMLVGLGPALWSSCQPCRRESRSAALMTAALY